MSSDNRFLDAVFYVPKAGREFSLAELLRHAAPGVTIRSDQAVDAAATSIVVTWAGIECIATMSEEEFHYRLHIEFHESHFSRWLPEEDEPVPVEEDPLMHMTMAFATTCELLGVDVAMIATRNYQTTDDEMSKIYPLITTQSGLDLVGHEYGLLYLSEPFCENVDLSRIRNRRDILRRPHGCLIFAGNETPYGRWS
jgi:hypothetical protein